MTTMVANEANLSEREFKAFQKLIYDLAGISLADTKQIMVQGRLSKRLRALDISSYREYYELLCSKQAGDEVERFINALTTNKTDFFREAHHFDYLTNTIFPKLAARAERTGSKKIRIWCSASSTGEEPYTIAMTIREYFGAQSDWDIRVLASDIDTDVLKTAQEGWYVDDRFDELPNALKKKYFEPVRGRSGFRAKQTLKDLVTFRQINLQHPQWPINTHFDVIFCRNVMIYFDAPSQKRLVSHFAEMLGEEGYLIIGHSESLLGMCDQYKSLGETVYQCTASASGKDLMANSTARCAARGPAKVNAIPRGLASSLPPQSQNESTGEDGSKHRIIVGEVHASSEPGWITTLLGSCVAVCLFDEAAGLGGMNHFLIPKCGRASNACATIGVHAMEILINRLMAMGADRRSFKAKVFGGGRVSNTPSDRFQVGSKNVQFAEEFLANEGIPIVASHTGGEGGMFVQFNPVTAKVLVRRLDRSQSFQVDREQRTAAAKVINEQLNHADITLF